MSAQTPSTPSAASHQARYQYERRLGEGGSGTVYLVRDLETGEQLALKKLLRVDAKSVLRLKREFRSIQSLNHPHIIKLYDMGQVDDSWFLTMEYLDGADFSTYLLREERYADANGQRSGPNGNPRLISAFRQLARGIHALHEAGMLHRDLKPSNVIVVDHRVVVLDFGLVRQMSTHAERLTEDGSVAGTPAYMAPEQLMAQELTAATDWYAFGVMLYEAISGMLPVDGPLLEMMQAKVDHDPLPLAALAPDAPAWICELCTALLQRDPAQRPNGDTVLARFDAADPQTPLTQTSADQLPQTETEAFEAQTRVFGREREVAQLWSAFERARDGRTVVTHVRAVSGAGKSALVEHFLQELPQRGAADVLVLRSRCYELEAMPFKALDGVMDALVLSLAQLDDLEVAHLLPADVVSLARVFPAFERLPAVKQLMASTRSVVDAMQTRRRAELGLRTVLDNLARRAPIVLWIDDLQWGDLDSAQVLRSWLSQPSAAPILFVLSYRADEVATSSCLRMLFDTDRDQPPVPAADAIDLLPLSDPEIEAMCELRLRTRSPQRAELIHQIVREAHGSPFLATQLIALADAKSARGDADLSGVSIDLMVAHIGALLDADAKQLLAILAIAGRPMSPKLALKAAGVQRGGRAVVHDLRTLNLARTRDVGGVRMLEVYHDRIRERVLGGLALDESRALHERLFRTLEWSGQADPDWLHSLALGAGQTHEAIQYGRAAAARASASLAFDRAAHLYQLCISLDPSAGVEAWQELSAAFARSGRGVEAAEAALEVSKRVSPEEKVTWTRVAAAHYMRCGRFARGEALIREVLEATGIHVPESEAGVLAAVVWERIRLKLRGHEPVSRPNRDYAPELITRVDVLLSFWASTQAVDPIRAMLFQLRAFRAALDAGEPTRLVRVLTAASTSVTFVGTPKAIRDSDALMARAIEINASLPNPDECVIASTQALNAFIIGRFHEVSAYADAAERLFRVDVQDDPTGNYSRRWVTTLVRVSTLYGVGDYPRLHRELRALRDEAIAADNRVIVLQMAYTYTLSEQIQGLAARSRERLDAERAQLPTARVGSPFILHMAAVMSTACWTREYDWARTRIEELWQRFIRSPLRRGTSMAVMAYETHARMLLNEHVEAGPRPEAFALAAKDVRALEKLSSSIASGVTHRIRARLAYLRNDRAEALRHLRECVALGDSRGQRHEVARDRFALGSLIGGAEGSAMCADARSTMTELGVADVEGDLRAHYPEALKGAVHAG